MRNIRRAMPQDIPAISSLAALLWPYHTQKEMEQTYDASLKNPKEAVFVAEEQNEPLGYAACSLRHDYVEGTSTSPVGYLEAIYVAEEARRQGMAGGLLAACRRWAKEQGCVEFASDCEVDNEESLRFHLHMGFEEANRIICLRTSL